jgi:hypothetical protein
MSMASERASQRAQLEDQHVMSDKVVIGWNATSKTWLAGSEWVDDTQRTQNGSADTIKATSAERERARRSTQNIFGISGEHIQSIIPAIGRIMPLVLLNIIW